MTKLPTPGRDDGHWGAILNDFLLTGHNSDGTLKGVQSVYNVKDYGAVGDGSANDTVAFAKAINSIPIAGGMLYVPDGIYKVDGILVNNRQDVCIMGSGGSSCIAPTAQHAGIIYKGCMRCHLSNLRIDGSINGGTIGLSITGNFDAKIFNLHINDMSGDGIYINGDDPAGAEIDVDNVTCRNNGGYGYHYVRMTVTDTGGVYLTNFRALYNTRGTGGISIESSNATSTPVFHVFVDTVADNYPATAVSLYNVAHCRFTRVWAGGSTSSSMFLVDGGGHMIEVDGAYFTNSNVKGYNLSINGTVNGVLLDNLDFDGSPAAHIHIGSSGANFFLGQYQAYGSAPLTDTLTNLYKRSNFMMQYGPGVFETDSRGQTATTVGFDDIRNPGKQKWLRNTDGTFQILNTAFNEEILGLQDNGQLRWNGGAWISKHLSDTSSWTPGAINAGTQVNTTVTVSGAIIGDTVATGFSLALPAGMLISGAVTAADTVTVTMFNASNKSHILNTGTIRADVWQHND